MVLYCGLERVGQAVLDAAMDRAEIGVSVRERLSRVPGIVKLPVPTLDAFILRDFLNEPQCEALIKMINLNRKPSRLFAQSLDPNFRTSETCNLDPKHTLVQEVEASLTMLLGIEPKYGEYLQGQRYEVGQQYKPHYDFLYPSEPYWPQQEKIGGQRTWTAMTFLNVPQQGGETFFKRIGVKITPRRGSLVTWNNLDARGDPNPHSLHQGMPVVAGVKYIITKWYRERPWADRSRDHKAPLG